MTHSELVAGLEERYDAVGHDIRLVGTGVDGAEEWSDIKCSYCRLEATVVSRNVGGWAVRHAGEDANWLFEERCHGLLADNDLERLTSKVYDAHQVLRDAEEALNETIMSRRAALVVYGAQR